MPESFGQQLLLDCYDCHGDAVENLDMCHAFLLDLVNVLGVQMQSPPFVFRTDAVRFPDKAGLSGWVPLVESGIQIHTLTLKQFVSLDVYSCHPIDVDTVLPVAEHWLQYESVDQQVIVRGTHYSQRKDSLCRQS